MRKSKRGLRKKEDWCGSLSPTIAKTTGTAGASDNPLTADVKKTNINASGKAEKTCEEKTRED